jgi:hypothetical protein
MVDILSMHVWIWNTETCEIIFKKGVGEEGKYEGGETNSGPKYVYMEMSQWNHLYNYHILIKTFKKYNEKQTQQNKGRFSAGILKSKRA